MRLQLSLGGPAPLPRERAVVVAPAAAAWPFTYPFVMQWPDGPVALSVPAIHEAFVNHQTASTRLVTTQAAFLLQAWSDVIGDRDVVIVATADRDSVAVHAPELLSDSGLFANVTVMESAVEPTAGAAVRGRGGAAAGAEVRGAAAGAKVRGPAADLLAAAFRADDPAERLRLCVAALEIGRTPAALLATASTCMEVNDLDAAARDLDEAIEKAPAWAATHFERAKLWLRRDDMEAASASFQQAALLMPRFASAWANLGATLGELDRPQAALDAFARALECDPDSAQTLNNIGVVSRELGKLAESEAAFRQVIQRAPDRAFGYYNLGHTLFLQGRYQAALGAYAEGQKRDPERNPVQATRLAMCRLASGDAAGALNDLQRATSGLPRDYRQHLLEDTRTIALALLTHRSDLAGWHQVNNWLAGELAK